MTKFLGIDESGRGAVIGPLVMCGYLIDSSKIDTLKEMGVKDSKLLTPKRRSALEATLKEIADNIVVIKTSSMDIDKLRSETNLNRIEAKHMQNIINSLDSKKIFIDSVEANTKKFKKEIISGLKNDIKERINNKEVDVICENFADKKYPVVSAASIIAKVTRDNDVEDLKKGYGDFGSGYSSDPRTVKFLKDWIKKNKKYPPFVRWSWLTAKEIRKEHEQKSMKDFTGK